MLKKLDGYKTYIIALLAGFSVVLEVLGYIDAGTRATFISFLMAGGLATLRDALPKKLPE